MSESNQATLVPKDYSGIITQMRRMLDELQDYCPEGNNLVSSNVTVETESQSTVDAPTPESEPINTPLGDDKSLEPEVGSQPENVSDEVCIEAAAARDALHKMCIGSRKDQMTKIIMENTIQTLPTGFPSLDEVLNGGVRNGTIVLGGIPSCGKSTLALQLASQNAEDGSIVIFVSLEMSEEILVAKSVARVLEQQKRNSGKKPEDPSISAVDILFGKNTSAEKHIDKEEIQFNIDQFYKMIGDNLIILDRKNSVIETANDIRTRIEAIVNLVQDAYGDEKSVIAYIDYLQIIPSQNNTTNDKVSVDCNMATFQKMANDLEIPVVIISSLGRTSYNKPISIDSFKESGSIEYSADTLIGLQYQGVGEKNFDIESAKNMNPRKVELSVLKQRTGSAGQKVPLDYYPVADLFVDPNAPVNPSPTTDSSDDDFDF